MSQNGDTIMPGELPEPLVPLLSPHLARQRWYAGDASASPSLRIVESGRLGGFDDFPCQMLWAIVRAEGAEYQLLIGERADLEARGHVSGEEAMIGTFDGRTYYDATADAEMALWLLSAASGGLESAKIARPVRVEQSNTSLVYDDRLILKVFRRVHPGPNPEAEVTTALVAAGFEHVALPFARWQHHGRDLAFGQQYLAGGTDGWALALTSLRDFYATPATEGLADPALSGGDFAAEATRLGLVTAEMHLCMAEAFGVDESALPEAWPAFVQSIDARVNRLDTSLHRGAAPVLEALRSVRSPGPGIRVHGDYHLGQVMRTDGGWYVLDFEGEPMRPTQERRRVTSPLKDVASMLRSLQYAASFVLGERTGEEAAALAPLAKAWEARNKRAFLTGYLDHEGVDALLPAGALDREAVRLAFEVDKALYEVAYEEAYRPTWTGIPLAALSRLLTGPIDEPDGYSRHEDEGIESGEV